VLLCFCTVHSIVCLMFMMWLPYGVINYNNYSRVFWGVEKK